MVSNTGHAFAPTLVGFSRLQLVVAVAPLSPEVANGQGTAKAGEHQAATAPDPLGGEPNGVLFEGGDCFTLIETNQEHPAIVNLQSPLVAAEGRAGQC